MTLLKKETFILLKVFSLAFAMTDYNFIKVNKEILAYYLIVFLGSFIVQIYLFSYATILLYFDFA